jgi:hypothetical protein
MKIRYGHVSNSSTNSFVMYAHELTTEQMKAMEIAVAKYNEECYEGYVGKSGRFFIGNVTMHDTGRNLLDAITAAEIPDEVWTTNN